MPHAVQSVPSTDDEASGQSFVRELARRAAGLGREVADIAGVMDDLEATQSRQAQTFEQLRREIAGVATANGEIDAEARAAQSVAGEARANVERALDETAVLAAAVRRVEEGIVSVSQALRAVSGAAEEIGQIAFQTRIVAFNASVEAVRAGAAGRGFAVVAEAVKDLAKRVQDSSQVITQTVNALGERVDDLAQHVGGRETGGSQRQSAEQAVAQAIATFREAFAGVQDRIVAMARTAAENTRVCNAVLQDVAGLSSEVDAASSGLSGARQRVNGLLQLSEQLIDLTAESGVETEDTPYIDAVVGLAHEIGTLLEDAVERGEITPEELFDEDYRPVPGTNPQQHLTHFVRLTDRLLPPLQEEMLAFSPAVVFCAAVDRNGFLPTHNRKFSRPQGKDPAWNAANCRNRRIFDDRTGLAAARNRKRFLLQTYRRDMGGGNYILMKDLSAPIMVHGRHWGGLRLGYRFDAGD